LKELSVFDGIHRYNPSTAIVPKNAFRKPLMNRMYRTFSRQPNRKKRQITEGNSREDFSKVFKIVKIFLETIGAYIENTDEKCFLKGPKHDQVEIGFFYTNQTHMVG
jgi:hypothetical protein